VLGLWIEETDALPKGKTNRIAFGKGFETVALGSTYNATILCDRVRPETATIIATYADDFYAGEPAFTVNSYGDGTGYYLATISEEAGYVAILSVICGALGIGSPLAGGGVPPTGIEVTQRVGPSGTDILYLLNHGEAAQTVRLEPDVSYIDLLTGDSVRGETTLDVRDVRVLRKQSP
jgi:beta-galactosidase